ncbi:MAG TPA: prepilin-type N-terminal cleavage/methylation domain-containing protein [Longimicrobiales bacterium]
MHGLLMNRPGFTLAEVMIALTLTAVVGAAVTGVFVSQSRFFDHQEKVGAAGAVTRGAMNIMMSEMRMIERDSGIASATSRRLTLRVPYAFGVVCDASGSWLTLSMLPVDHAVLADSGYSGFAYRSASGDYTYVSGFSMPAAGGSGACAASGLIPGSDGIVPDTSGGTGVFAGSAVRIPLTIGSLSVGTPVFLYQLITYEFKPSASVPGSQVALWRRVHRTNREEELVGPFDTTARFRFYVNDGAAAQTPVPSALSTVTGVEIILDAISERPASSGTHQTVPLTTSVFFRNR